VQLKDRITVSGYHSSTDHQMFSFEKTTLTQSNSRKEDWYNEN